MATHRPRPGVWGGGASSVAGIVLAVLLVSSLAGCLSRAELPQVPPVQPVQNDANAQLPMTAILLFANESNTVDAPEILRKFMFEELSRHRFKLQSLEETETTLREQLKISDGGQLTSATPQELGQALGADQLFFGDVQEWKKITTGVYNTVSVKATVSLVEAKSGTVLWEKTQAVTRQQINTSVGDIVAGAVGSLLLSPMTPYAKQLAREIGRQLPN